jgi:hypothetical protein
MKRSAFAMFALSALMAAGQPAGAQTSRQAVVAAPAVVEPTTKVEVVAAPPAIVIVPAPLPPVPPNSCSRGNSSGVSRC